VDAESRIASEQYFRRRHPITRDEANSTENSPATSPWLPPGASEYDVRREVGEGKNESHYLFMSLMGYERFTDDRR